MLRLRDVEETLGDLSSRRGGLGDLSSRRPFGRVGSGDLSSRRGGSRDLTFLMLFQRGSVRPLQGTLVTLALGGPERVSRRKKGLVTLFQ